jgi:prepilin peptidase CpaA
VISEFLVLGVLPVLFLAAAGWDIASYTIPNFLQVALIALFVVFVLFSGMSFGAFGLHLVAGMVGLAIGFAFFSLGYVGGGDAKLFACAALWFGLRDLPDYTLFASVFGGLLTLGLLSFRKIPLPQTLGSQEWILRLHDQQAGIPYGAALAAGAFAIIPYTDVFRLGVAG